MCCFRNCKIRQLRIEERQTFITMKQCRSFWQGNCKESQKVREKKSLFFFKHENLARTLARRILPDHNWMRGQLSEITPGQQQLQAQRHSYPFKSALVFLLKRRLWVAWLMWWITAWKSLPRPQNPTDLFGETEDWKEVLWTHTSTFKIFGSLYHTESW